MIDPYELAILSLADVWTSLLSTAWPLLTLLQNMTRDQSTDGPRTRCTSTSWSRCTSSFVVLFATVNPCVNVPLNRQATAAVRRPTAVSIRTPTAVQPSVRQPTGADTNRTRHQPDCTRRRSTSDYGLHTGRTSDHGRTAVGHSVQFGPIRPDYKPCTTRCSPS